MTRRREREVDRELLRLAKLKHAESFGDDAPIDRELEAERPEATTPTAESQKANAKRQNSKLKTLK